MNKTDESDIPPMESKLPIENQLDTTSSATRLHIVISMALIVGLIR